MKVLVTGANGFVGYYLVKALLEQGYEVLATAMGENRLSFNQPQFHYASMDFTDPFAVHDVFHQHTPGVVIHAGAMSKPDACEKEQWQAYLVNVEGTLNLLSNAEEQKAYFIFLSTDFVFDGEKGMYTEEDERNPINFYGRTKMDAEDAVMEYPFAWSIVRTCFVYGKNHAGRQDFVELIHEKLRTQTFMKIVADQERTPTYVQDLATGIVSMMQRKATGVYHISGEEKYSPYEIALRVSSFFQLDASCLAKVTQSSFTEPAKRPLRTGFIITKAAMQLDFKPVSLEDGLRFSFHD
jgi:dTDP-4-dehydrorhamnose reductase